MIILALIVEFLENTRHNISSKNSTAVPTDKYKNKLGIVTI